MAVGEREAREASKLVSLPDNEISSIKQGQRCRALQKTMTSHAARRRHPRARLSVKLATVLSSFWFILLRIKKGRTGDRHA